jgi:hypothetical protein
VTVIAFAIDKLGEIISTVGQEIQTAVDKIVDAFQAFVDWLIDFVCDAILDPLTSMIEDVWDGVVDWAAGLGATLSRLAAEVDAGARSIASATLALVQSIVESDAFLVISLIGFAIFTVMLVLQPTVAPFMFVLDMIVPIVMMAILDANGGFITDAAGEIASAAASTVENTIRTILGNDLVNMEATMFGIIFSSVGSLITFVSTAVMGTMRDFASFAVSILGAILSVASLTQINEQSTDFTWVKISCVGLALSGAGFALEVTGKGTEGKICPSFDSVSKLISGLDLGVSALSVGTTYNAWSSGE